MNPVDLKGGTHPTLIAGPNPAREHRRVQSSRCLVEGAMSEKHRNRTSTMAVRLVQAMRASTLRCTPSGHLFEGFSASCAAKNA
jgi:hypothetical protein